MLILTVNLDLKMLLKIFMSVKAGVLLKMNVVFKFAKN